jgi:hypothetical protein
VLRELEVLREREVLRRGFFAAPAAERAAEDRLAPPVADLARVAAGFFAAVLLRALLFRAVVLRAVLLLVELLRAPVERFALLREAAVEPPVPSSVHLPDMTR